MLRIWVAILAAIFVATPAHAKWREASSDHFVIYADDSEKDLRKFAENLERYHSAMELLTRRKVEKPSPSNRVTIFVVGDQRDIRKLAGKKERSIAGFYIPRAGASRAFVQDINLRGKETSFSMIVLLHEYAHHFLISGSRYAKPRWMSEGAAEFYASAKFDSDGGISIGRPALHRAAELFLARKVPVRQLFDHKLYKEKKRDSFYGWSWALFHYLRFSEERKGQIEEYKRQLVGGTPSLKAAHNAFGDLDTLQKDLNRYVTKRRLNSIRLNTEDVEIGDIDIRILPAGEAEMMPMRIRSQRGVDEEKAADLIGDVRIIAAKYPTDPGVLTALAEAEYDAGNDAEAIAAADKAIALDPNRKNAYVQKGYALFRQAEDADDADAAYKEALKPFSALNKVENDHPLPLIYYYRSFAERGKEPSENAKHALERAAELAPFDKELWFQVGNMHAQDGKIELAKWALQPIADDPHGGRSARLAATLLSALDHAEEGKPFLTNN